MHILNWNNKLGSNHNTNNLDSMTRSFVYVILFILATQRVKKKSNIQDLF
jgi:hypothetical protein